MISQKAENLLNLALAATPQERERSQELNIGFDSKEQTWELIIKYSGDLRKIREIAVRVSELLNEYAVVEILESRISELESLPQIEYIEKPKRLFFQVETGKRVSCILEVQESRFSLFGKGILVGIVDSGIDYALEEFRMKDGKSRIQFLWDQSLDAIEGEAMPAPYGRGVEYTKEEIDRALQQRKRLRTLDQSGHGTAVAGIAAGNSENYQGVAAESDLIIVKMGNRSIEGFPRTTELMMGVDYVVRKALELRKPVAINVSFGNTYGAHDGSSLLERFLEDIANKWKSVICIGTGNEGNSAGHTAGILKEGQETVIDLAVQELSPGLNVQIWKAYFDEVSIALESPGGERIGPVQELLGPQRFQSGGTKVLLYYGEPAPFSIDQEIYIDFLPERDYIDSGIWKVILRPKRIVKGEFALWLPSESSLNRGTGFLFPNAERTLTIPSTAYRTIGVGAYDPRNFSYADFSGRGPAGPGRRQKPDVTAPGVDILVLVPGGGRGIVQGTSFAVPFVTGGAALLMEWGIVNGNDPFLYGEKIKAYLQRGAKELPGIEEYPNSQVGYGALCVEQSIPE